MVNVGYDINRYSPRQMVSIPLAIFIVACALLAVNTLTTGMPVQTGIDFAGGTAVTVFTSDSTESLDLYFSAFPLMSITEGISGGKYLKFGPMDDESFHDLMALVSSRYPDAKVDQIGETFGRTLHQQALLALLFSFAGMSVVVFIAFRTVIPSLAVILSALSDIAIAAACMSLLGIPLTLGTTAALLMLIGYSVDSDILLTTRTLKRRGKLNEKLEGAFRTGVIMTTTTLSALAAMWVVSSIGQVQIIAEISVVLLFGLVIDIMNTWMLNAGLMKWYVLRRDAK